MTFKDSVEGGQVHMATPQPGQLVRAPAYGGRAPGSCIRPVDGQKA